MYRILFPQVNAYLGAFIEGLATLLCRLASRSIADLGLRHATVIDSFIGTSLVVAGKEKIIYPTLFAPLFIYSFIFISLHYLTARFRFFPFTFSLDFFFIYCATSHIIHPSLNIYEPLFNQFLSSKLIYLLHSFFLLACVRF